MKIALLLKLASVASSLFVCDAFSPQNGKTRRTQALNAKTLEGWKIDGIIKPINNFILVEKEKAKSESDGGILLSQSVSL